MIETVKKENDQINLCGDGRSDSPGNNAKYGAYSLMDETSGKTIIIQQYDVWHVSSGWRKN